MPRGCEQQVFVHMSGNVIFSVARCCRRSRFWESKRKTEKARWRRPLSMFSIKWPVARQNIGNKSRILSHLGRLYLRQLLTDFLARASDRLVIVVQYNADLIHQLDLLLIVTCERIVVAGGLVRPANNSCVDLREESSNVLSCDFGVLSDGGGRAHVCDRAIATRKTVKALVGKSGEGENNKTPGRGKARSRTLNTEHVPHGFP